MPDSLSVVIQSYGNSNMAIDEYSTENGVNESFFVKPESGMNGEQTRRDMFDLTVWKIRSLNYPTGRDSSLRKSVLIYNLLRCLQSENCFGTASDVEMISDSAMDGRSVRDADQESQGEQAIDDIATNDALDAETQSAVISLAIIDQDQNSELLQPPHPCYQISPSTGAAWNLTYCNSAEPDAMDVDQPDGLTCASVASLPRKMDTDNNYHDSADAGLITESYHLIENGGYMVNDHNFPADRVRWYGAVSTNGDYRPFDCGNSFNLFA